jgi:hypothetical protein
MLKGDLTGHSFQRLETKENTIRKRVWEKGKRVLHDIFLDRFPVLSQRQASITTDFCRLSRGSSIANLYALRDSLLEREKNQSIRSPRAEFQQISEPGSNARK